MAKPKKSFLSVIQPKADLSPMIDLVFLLLIFFMVTSTAIRNRQDPNVSIPVADKSSVPEVVDGRILVNIYADGSAYDENSSPMSLEQIEIMMSRARSSNPNARLYLRADRGARHEAVKKVIDASSRGGVSQVIFSTFQTAK